MKKLYMLKHLLIPAWATTACAFLTLGVASASAQVYAPPTYVAPIYVAEYSPDVGFYLNGNLGPSFMPDFQSSRFGFPGSFSTRPGVRFGAEPGFNFLSGNGLTLGAEFETGVIYNYLHSVQDAGAPTPLRGDYYQVPLLGNLELKFHPGSFVVPYVGIGAGGDWSEARLHLPGYFGFGPGSYGSENRSDEVDPAVQAMGGVRFKINSMIDVGMGYKFLAAFPSEGRYIATHAALATVTVRF
jgi:opacity protein-like surface antigen